MSVLHAEKWGRTELTESRSLCRCAALGWWKRYEPGLQALCYLPAGVLALDTARLTSALVGVIVQPASAVQSYGDCLVLSGVLPGVLLIFLSLLLWLLWYMGNLHRIPAIDLPPRNHSPLPRHCSILFCLGSKLSRCLSQHPPPPPPHLAPPCCTSQGTPSLVPELSVPDPQSTGSCLSWRHWQCTSSTCYEMPAPEKQGPHLL